VNGGGSQRFVLVEILLVSCTVLFLELALIRWLPANIYSLAFFSNLVLLAAFYGFGLGNLCGTLRFDMMRVWPFYVCVFVAVVLLLRDLEVLIPERSAEWIWSRYRGDQISSGNFEVPIEIVLIALFFAVAAVFVPLGQRLARLMVRVESLNFYNFDLLGSLIGIAFFAVMSAAATRPHVWFALAAILVLPVLVGGNRQRSILLALPLVAVIALAWHTSKGEIWSPYYSILTRPSASGIQVFVNRLCHQ